MHILNLDHLRNEYLVLSVTLNNAINWLSREKQDMKHVMYKNDKFQIVIVYVEYCKSTKIKI